MAGITVVSCRTFSSRHTSADRVPHGLGEIEVPYADTVDCSAVEDEGILLHLVLLAVIVEDVAERDLVLLEARVHAPAEERAERVCRCGGAELDRLSGRADEDLGVSWDLAGLAGRQSL